MTELGSIKLRFQKLKALRLKGLKMKRNECWSTERDHEAFYEVPRRYYAARLPKTVQHGLVDLVCVFLEASQLGPTRIGLRGGWPTPASGRVASSRGTKSHTSKLMANPTVCRAAAGGLRDIQEEKARKAQRGHGTRRPWTNSDAASTQCSIESSW